MAVIFSPDAVDFRFGERGGHFDFRHVIQIGGMLRARQVDRAIREVDGEGHESGNEEQEQADTIENRDTRVDAPAGLALAFGIEKRATAREGYGQDGR